MTPPSVHPARRTIPTPRRVATYLLVRLVRRREAGRWPARAAPGLGLVARVVLVLVAFGALDTLLPPSF